MAGEETTSPAASGRLPRLTHEELRHQAWEQIAFIAITHIHTRTGMARRVHDRVATSRAQQDNEMFHLLIIEELISRSGLPQSRIKFSWLPQAIAFVYYQLSWLLFAVRPSWSYRLNADFEDHAEHEYMTMVAEHSEWESASFESEFDDDFGHFASLADVFRQIAHDERMHKLESEALMKAPRFRWLPSRERHRSLNERAARSWALTLSAPSSTAELLGELPNSSAVELGDM